MGNEFSGIGILIGDNLQWANGCKMLYVDDMQRLIQKYKLSKI